jgi:hypothetical protein
VGTGGASGGSGGQERRDGPQALPVDAPVPPLCDPRANQPCDRCGGTSDCSGACQKREPAGFGQSCGSCGGTVGCDGTCSKPDPATLGNTCDSCGGTIGCDGRCQNKQPSNFGASCDSCGGTIGCNGCERKQPSNFGQSCGACGGKIGCSGACEGGGSPNAGQTCDTCGDRFDCFGGCPTTNQYIQQDRQVTINGPFMDPADAAGRVQCPAGQKAVECQDLNGLCGPGPCGGDLSDAQDCSCCGQVANQYPATCRMRLTIQRDCRPL